MFNELDYECLFNGSIYLKLYDKIYNNNIFMIYGKRLFLCVNFLRNFIVIVKEFGNWYNVMKI